MAGSDVDRAEVFLETKIWISDYGYDQTLHGFDKSATVEHPTALLDASTVVPAVNQIEVNPYFQQREVQRFGVEQKFRP